MTSSVLVNWSWWPVQFLWTGAGDQFNSCELELVNSSVHMNWTGHQFQFTWAWAGDPVLRFSSHELLNWNCHIRDAPIPIPFLIGIGWKRTRKILKWLGTKELTLSYMSMIMFKIYYASHHRWDYHWIVEIFKLDFSASEDLFFRSSDFLYKTWLKVFGVWNPNL